MKKRVPFKASPEETQKQRDKIVHGAYLTEGSMAAFPLCFPGVTTAIPMDESLITALTMGPDNLVYGGTSGYKAHIFVGMLFGATGMVFDLWTFPESEECTAVCCSLEDIYAFVNGPAGGKLFTRPLEKLPFDLLQEWGFERQIPKEISLGIGSEKVLDAHYHGESNSLLIITPTQLKRYFCETGEIHTIGSLVTAGKSVMDGLGNIWGMEDNKNIWSYSISRNTLKRAALSLPDGSWSAEAAVWAVFNNLVYTSDREGKLYSLTYEKGFSSLLGELPFGPVSTMAVTHDGRLYGCTGEGIGKFFTYHGLTKQLKVIGVAVSFLERRRYGYQFGAAVTGKDGQIFFGENDNKGHLWVYFPSII